MKRMRIRSGLKPVYVLGLLVAFAGTYMPTTTGGAATGDADGPWSELPFAPGDHCVAYRTSKGMFFAFDVDVVGRSCAVTAFAQQTEDGAVKVTAAVPVDSFDSDNGSRDEHVAEILGAPRHKLIHFASRWIDPRSWNTLVTTGQGRVPGTLRVAGREHAVTFDVRLHQAAQGWVAQGRLATTFAALGVRVPSVGPGGMIAAPGEDLELLLQFRSDRVKGADTLPMSPTAAQ